jgi:hypothetical protein
MTTGVVDLETSVPAEGEKTAKLSLPAVCVLLGCLSFAGYVLSTRSILDWMAIPFANETLHVARSLATDGRFADPFGWVQVRTGYTAHVAPVYPLLVALVFREFGNAFAILTVLWVANIVFLSVQMALLPYLSDRMGLGVLPGLVAAVVGVFSLPYAVDFEWESLLAGMELALLCLLMVESLRTSGSGRKLTLTGCLWGIALLTNPMALLLLVPWAVAVVFAQPPSLQAAKLREYLGIAGIAFLVCAPWIVRNWVRLGAVFFIRDNLGIELSVSNTDCASASLAGNVKSGCHFATHPNLSEPLQKELAAVGEYRFNQERMRRALSWIASHPKRFASLTAQRFVLFWFPTRGLAHFRRLPPVLWCITLTSFAGFVRLWRRNRVDAWILGGALLVYPLVYYVIQFEPRYRDPILWVTLLLTGYALAAVLPESWRRRWETIAG